MDSFAGTGLGIRWRLFLGFSLMTAILIITISLLLVKINSSDYSATTVITTDLPLYDSLRDMGNQVSILRAALQEYTPNKSTTGKNEISNTLTAIDADIDTVNRLSVGWPPDRTNTWNKIKPLFSALRSSAEKITGTADPSNSTPASTELHDNFMPKMGNILDLLDGPKNSNGIRSGGIFDSAYNAVHDGTGHILSDIDFIRMLAYVFLAVGMTASFIIALYTAGKILRPLNSAIAIAEKIASGERRISISTDSPGETGVLLSSLAVMQAAIESNEEKLRQSEAESRNLLEKIVKTADMFSKHSANVAKGDLTRRIPVEPGSEMMALGNDLNTMTESLSSVARKITTACHGMVSALQEVRHSVDIQSTGANEQASSINEITASLEEIEKSSAQTIEKAKNLGDAAERTREKGQQGLNAIDQSIAGMQVVRDKVQTIAQTILDLSNQTQQIGEITAVVTGLAQQSKMLSLNASIEAAKAGEAGKGFAVVAAEVKTLSEQSEQSTAQVQKILEDIRRATERAVMATEEGTKGVDIGTSLVEQTGEIVRDLSAVIHETTIATQQIEAAIRQENVGIEQITAGMNEINQVTTAFVENVNQTTQAINNIADIAGSLKEHVDVYKI